MSKQAAMRESNDPAVVAAIGGEAAVLVREILAKMAPFAQDPAKAPISRDIRGLSRIAEFVGARAIIKLCEPAAALAAGLEANGAPLVKMEADVLGRALGAAAAYLAGCGTGRFPAALSLYPVYCALAALTPKFSALSTGEFYFPQTLHAAEETPADSSMNLSDYLSGDGAMLVRYQGEYRAAFMMYAKTRNPDALVKMRQALVTLETKKPPAGYRLFLSASIAFLDTLIRADNEIPAEARALLSRIERELTHLAAGGKRANENLVSALLYSLATSECGSARVRKLKDALSLERYVTKGTIGKQDHRALDALRDARDWARQAWESGLAKDDLSELRNGFAKLGNLSTASGDYALGTFGACLRALIEKMHTGAIAKTERVAVFGASLLLMMEERLARMPHDPMGDREIADLQKQKVRAILAGADPGTVTGTDEDDGIAMAPILVEAMVDLNTAEQMLDQMTRDPAHAAKKPEVLKLMHSVQSICTLAQVPSAAELAERCVALVNSCFGEPSPAARENLARLAAGCIALERSLSLARVSREQAGDAAREGIEACAERVTEANAQSGPTDATGEWDAPAEEEMLDIYLEEAGQVSRELESGLAAMESNAANFDAMSSLRRGFHTLKGGARMIGLERLGEIAWSVERTVNQFLASRTVATPALLAFAARARHKIMQHAATLHTERRTAVEVSSFAAEADRLTECAHAPGGAAVIVLPAAAKRPPRPLAAEGTSIATITRINPLMQQSAAPERSAQETPMNKISPVEDAMFKVGAIEIPDCLFQIFAEESAQLCADLALEVDKLFTRMPHKVEFDLMRHAHSLSGMGRTVGIDRLAELAHAIESWASLRLNRIIVPEDWTRSVLFGAIEGLQDMLKLIRAGCEPMAAYEAVARIDILNAEFPDRRHNAEDALATEFLESLKAMECAAFDAPSSVATATEVEATFAEPQVVETPLVEAPATHALVLDAPAIEVPHTQTTTMEALFVEAPAVAVHVVEAPTVEVPAVEVPVVEAPAAPVPVLLSPVNAHARTLHDVAAWSALIKAAEDDIDSEACEFFFEEADELYPRLDTIIAKLRVAPGNRAQVEALKRVLHTLKGGANTTGARKIGAVFHQLEDLVATSLGADPATLDRVQSGVDISHALLDALRTGADIAGVLAGTQAENADADTQVEISTISMPTGPEPTTASVTEAVTATATATTTPSTVGISPRHASDAASAPKTGGESILRVRSGMIGALGEMNIEANTMRSRAAFGIVQCKQTAQGMSLSVDKLSELVKQVDLEAEKQMHAGSQHNEAARPARADAFDALELDRFTRLQELTRRVAETMNDVQNHGSVLSVALRATEDSLSQQGVLLAEIGTRLDQTRQVRISSIVPHLKRVVRQACRDSDKRADLLVDADVEVDRWVLDRLVPALEHVLRNAVAHGIETAAVRAAAGKPETGTVELRAYHEGSHIVIEVSDDGRGLDRDAILRRGLERGLIPADTRASDERVPDLIFTPGFSTAAIVSGLAGRGVGLDVVRSDLDTLGGRVAISSETNMGSRVVLRAPSTMSVMNGCAVYSNGYMFVIPSQFIRELVRVDADDLNDAYGNGELWNAGKRHAFRGMWQVAGMPRWEGSANARNAVLLMNGEDLAIHVDDVKPVDEFIFRRLGAQIDSVKSGVIGATINAKGTASLFVDPIRAVRVLGQRSLDAGVATQRNPRIMVVDDSLTVRKMSTRLLERNGYDVDNAENGLVALERMHAQRPDLVLMDIEMPILDGFACTERMRADDLFRDIPVIIVSSRAVDKHRAYAIAKGANEFVGKPYKDQDLLALIKNLLERGALRNAA